MISSSKKNREAIKYWEKKVLKHRRSSYFFMMLLILGVTIGVISIMFGIVMGVISHNIDAIYLASASTTGLVILFFLVRREIKRSIKKIENKKSNRLYQKKESFQLDLIIMSVCRNLRFNPNSINIFIDTKDFSIGPSVFKGKIGDILIIPIGFVNFSRKNGNIAKAILTHEFGHILQGDTRQLRFIAAYQAGYLKKIIPIFFPLIILLLIFSIFDIISISGDISKHKVAIFSGDSVGHQLRMLYEFTIDKAEMIISLIQNSLNLLSIVITVIWVRNIRINSEHLSDLLAYIHTDETSIFGAFRYSSQKKSDIVAKVLAIQPSLGLRYYKLKKLIPKLS